MLDEQQIQKRRPVWVVLSELWLDTELSTEDFERIARVLAESELTLDKLLHVYRSEVAPVLSLNLFAVAGEWNHFDEKWLCSEIISNLRDGKRWKRFLFWFPFTRRLALNATEKRWKRLLELVQRYRDDGPSKGVRPI